MKRTPLVTRTRAAAATTAVAAFANRAVSDGVLPRVDLERLTSPAPAGLWATTLDFYADAALAPGAAQPRASLLAREAGEVMTRTPRTISPDSLAAEAMRAMEQRSITALFVVDAAGAPVGILHIHDLLRAGVA